MDIFGDHWKNHSQKIIENWKSIVKEEDTVLLPGDLSWGMRIDEAAADCNADGKINLLDLILMRKYLAKWNVVLGVQPK